MAEVDELTRLSVYVLPDTAAILRAERSRGMTVTNQIRRAIAVYDYLNREIEAGGTVLIRKRDGVIDELDIP